MPTDLTCCQVTIGKSQFKYTSIMCRKFQRKLVIGLDVQQLLHLDCDWTDDGEIFLHQGTDLLITSINTVTSIKKSKKALAMCRFLLIVFQLCQQD